MNAFQPTSRSASSSSLDAYVGMLPKMTGDFGKPVALCGLDIAFGLTFTTPSGEQHAVHNGAARRAPPEGGRPLP